MFFGATSIAQVPIGDDASVTRNLVTGVSGNRFCWHSYSCNRQQS